MGAKTSKLPPSNLFWILSNIFWIFFTVVLTKVLFWSFEILSFWFLTNFWISPLYPMGKPKTSIIWKTSDRRLKQSEIWASGWVISVHRVLLRLKCLRSFWVHWVQFCFFDNPVSRKRLVAAKGETEWNLGLRGDYPVYTGYLWHFLYTVIKIIRCIPISGQACISKMAGRRAKGIEIWASVCTGYFWHL